DLARAAAAGDRRSARSRGHALARRARTGLPPHLGRGGHRRRGHARPRADARVRARPGIFRQPSACPGPAWPVAAMGGRCGALGKAVQRDVATLQQEFGRSFAGRPAVYAFATRTGFAFGLQEIFGVRGPDAGLLAVANGGITLPRQGAIVLNLQNVPNDKDFAIVRHELTHALVHETIGVDSTLPAWFDEGLATLEERAG